MGHSSKDMKERFQWTFPIVFDPLDPNTLYIGSQHLWRTVNGGMSWDRISGDLTRADVKTMGPSGGPITLDQTGVETYATDLHHRPVAQGARNHLDRLRRRRRQPDARQRQDLESRDAAGSARLRPLEPDRGVAAQARDGISRRQSIPAGRPQAVRLSHRRLRQDVDEDRQRHRRRRLRPRHPRGHRPSGTAVSRHRARHLRLARRRRQLAVVAAEPAGHTCARHRRRSERPGHRHAWPLVLDSAEHRHASSAHAGSHGRQRVPVQASRRDPLPGQSNRRALAWHRRLWRAGDVRRRHRLLPEERRPRRQARDSGCVRQGPADVHEHCRRGEEAGRESRDSRSAATRTMGRRWRRPGLASRKA